MSGSVVLSEVRVVFAPPLSVGRWASQLIERKDNHMATANTIRLHRVLRATPENLSGIPRC